MPGWARQQYHILVMGQGVGHNTQQNTRELDLGTDTVGIFWAQFCGTATLSSLQGELAVVSGQTRLHDGSHLT